MTNITSKWYTPFAKATNNSQNLVHIVEKVTPLVCFIESDISGDHGIIFAIAITLLDMLADLLHSGQ